MNICHNSKHFLNVLLLIVALLCINTNAWAADCYSVTKSSIKTDATYETGRWIKTKHYYYSSPKQCIATIDNLHKKVSVISFTVTGDTENGEQKFKVMYKKSGEADWTVRSSEYTLSRSLTWSGYVAGSKSISLNANDISGLEDAVEVGVWCTNYNANGSGADDSRTLTISSFSVTFNPYFASVSDGTTLAAFPSTEVDTECETTRSFAFDYNSRVTSYTWTSSNDVEFPISFDSYTSDCGASKEVIVQFKPKTIGNNLTSTITGKDNNGNTITVKVTGVSWGKADPIYSINGTYWDEYGTQKRTVYVGDVITNVFGTTSTATPVYTIATNEIYGANNGEAVTTFSANTLTAGCAGEYVLTITQPEKSTSSISGYKEGTKSVIVRVEKYPNTLSIAKTSDSKYVDDELTEFVNNKNNTETALTTYSTAAGVAHYDIGANKIVIDNSSNESFNSKEVTITISQAENYKYEAAEKELSLTVKKIANSLSCSWGGWYKNLNFDEGAYVTFAATNTSSPITVNQISGNLIATYYPGQNAIYASYSVGKATWAVSQAENYKYLAAATKTLTINVGTIDSECYVLNDNSKTYELHTIQKGPAFELTGPGDKLYLDAWKDLIAIDYGLPIQYSTDGVNFYDLTTIDLSYESKTFGPFTLPNGTTHILLESRTGSTLVKYYKNLRVTRKKWLKIQDKNANDIDEITMPVNTVGDNNKTANFYINYSTCADEIKVVSNHPRVTVSETTFKSDGNGNKQITLTYTGSVPESLEALITVYTPSENKTLKVYAQTVKQTQTLLWSTGYEESTVYLPVGLSDANPATASSGLTPVLYSTNNSDIIRIADDGQSFSITGIGTATLTATQAGDADRWNPVSETKTINATDKKIQVIHWEQNFSRSIAPGDLKDLLAEVYINNPLTGTQTKSDERTALIQYSCPENNGVISLSGNQMTVLDYGTTSITASVAGNENYEAATMTLLVNVRAPSAECEDPLIVNHTEQIQIFSMNIDWTDWTTPPVIGDTIFFDEALGKPDKLSFQHEGEEYPIPVVSNIKVYRGAITVQQRVNGNWLVVPGSEVTPTKYEWNMLSGLQLDENADAIRFVRLVRGQGYHNIKDVQVTLLQYLRADEENIDLGNVQAGATLNAVIGFDYSNLKGDLSVSKLPAEDTYLSFDETIEVDCGSQGHHNFPISFTPKTIGDWEGYITITEPISSKSIIVHLTATVTKGSQSIQWGATTSICATEAPILNATATSNLPVSYAVTAGADVAEIVDGEVVINKTTGSFTITASQTGDVNYFAAENLVKTFTLITPTSLVLTAPIADDIIYPAELGTSALSGGAATANGTPVSGSWTWKEPTTILNPGEAQEIAVIFTPSANECRYTGFETTATINVKRAQFIFDGSGKEADDPNHVTWCYDDNWEKNQKPGSEDKVLIDHNVVIRQEVSVYSVTINEGDTLTIMPTGGLTVGTGGIIGATTGNLILKAGTEGETKGQTGYLRISPESTEPMPEATVELYSIGYYNMGEAEHNAMASWQFVGVPMVGGQSATSVFRVSFIYNWDETNDAWENNRSSLILQPFAGYATSQYFFKDGMLITNAGQLVPNTGITEIELDYSGVGHNVVANSFTAPIDITKFDDEDFENAEKVIYLFNTGSKNDVKAIEETKNAASSYEAKGQFIPIPVGSASSLKKAFPALPTSIAPMQGFCVNATGDEAKIKLDYKKLVWEGASKNTPLRVKARDEETSLNGALCVSISAKGWSDNLYLIESNDYSAEYENGFDATKRMSGSLNVFAVEGDVNLSVDATNSIAGTRVGVRTGEEMTYTMNFSHVNSENPLVLWDKEAQFKMLISEDLEYTFNAEPNSEITERFQIIAADIPTIATGVDEVESEVHIQKFIKDNQLYILKDGVLYNASGAVVRK